MTLLIYKDQGVCPKSALLLGRFLKKIEKNILFVTSEELKNKQWMQKARLIVFPGGQDIFYHQKLSGKANDWIYEFVSKGGSYLGICAGAYFGTAFVEFDKGGALEVLQKRELQFFPGKSIGPVLGVYQYGSEIGAKTLKIKTEKTSFFSYYNGGCFFENAHKYKSIEVIGRYEELPDKPAAIIRTTIGKGKVILSGVHLEYESHKKSSWDQDLKSTEDLRNSFFRSLLYP